MDIKKLRELCEEGKDLRQVRIEFGAEDWPAEIVNEDGETLAAEMSNEDAEYFVAIHTALPEALDEIERLRSEIDGALSMLSLVQEPSCDQSAWLELAIEKLEKAREG